ncbi:hypothetical protein BMS3Abin07_01143 [bacterium BMS3Abin07]|nr:hypothetical protein BMS3Abin07_01143 [bacterium BMS3Abin07]GBE31582.1 hypothetical protein BMS3Bbin05_00485 [bacterium BMS3Bbin05]HDL20711.1 hypothetical protein [Nitrospirota bacterium]HDO23570.1 hypothetical protein [Nitrospirota bacterium]HDZ88052.1 hypothetical protein [Nitrospirota bacterium]
MPKKDKPLPTPPSTPFGRKKRPEHAEEKSPLLTDRLATAMAEGKLNEFLEKEMPENEHARKLAEMMMGMTGMMPMQGNRKREGEHTPMPPEDIVDAVKTENVGDLVGLLKREHEKRHPDNKINIPEKPKSFPDEELSNEEKEIIDRLVEISTANKVSLDWLILRALKFYVKEYEKTGKL